MNTRNSAIGSRNSFFRARGSSTLRNNISIKLQDNTKSPRPKVAYSPANRNTVQSQANTPKSSHTSSAGRKTAHKPVHTIRTVLLEQ